ncbi:hypothetical protein A33M_1695 [Rhodovulum sp. PH10]|uniref:hypothetical protein n=1 Tax=Rhodovulum sp. PH10 TaxID=1187851 RepID=UPI00027C2338|nr:hypothetical protein [Rhodovulum sp. PH10]EJW12725.1 hypothetical protein A33M_1695 [Rhodovulum sp. PH10]
MVARIILGQRGGIYDLWVSKPGVDVETAPYGRLLLGGNTGAQQVVAQGNTALSGSGALPTSTIHHIALPAEIAGFSDLFVWGYVYYTRDYAGGEIGWWNFQYQKGMPGDASFRVEGGTLVVRNHSTASIGSSSAPCTLRARWVIFREAY